MRARHSPEDEPVADARDPVEVLVEEFFARRRRGDLSDVDEFARRVPGREEEFRELVATLATLESAAAASGARSGAPAPLEGRERLGRFRLLRLIGRGGMGAVFEAIDGELSRRVALKILPGHASLEEREITRFHREAEAAASLRHPHIVPVFGVGEDEGTHWIAMQLVPGENLERLLRRGRESGGARMDVREVARHGLAVAEALACAHAEGVLHRDVKPSNLLLDTSGVVWITDFGLAKSEGNATLTRTGETVGTPRYMAPEAFSGWADPRSDVWGLGATLYELLAARPAFDGSDRAQLLKQISDVEPAPLRRLDPSIPGDLATIVHKCLQKEPSARYATASELADDLRRFLAGEPIRARPPSLAYRISLIGRRHPTATLLVIVALAGGVVMTSREAARAREAEHGAQRRFDDVRKLAGSFLFEIHDAIRNLPGSTAARKLVVARGLEYLDRLAAESAGDPGLRRELAGAYQKFGDVQGNPFQPNLGDLAGARRSYRTAIDLLRPGVESGEATDEDRTILASAWLVGGGIEVAGGDSNRGVEMSRKGLELRKELAARDRTRPRMQELATAWQYTAFSLTAARRENEANQALDEQAALLRELLAADPRDPSLIRSWGQHLYMRGTRSRDKGDYAGSGRYFDDAIAAQRGLIATEPGNTSLRRDLMWSLTDQAILLERQQRFPEAFAVHLEALSLNRALEAADPENRDAKVAVATAENNVASVLLSLGRPEEVLDHVDVGIARCESVLADDASNAFCRGLLALLWLNAGDAHSTLGDPASLESACDSYEKSIAIYEGLSADGGIASTRQSRLAYAREKLAGCEARLAH